MLCASTASVISTCQFAPSRSGASFQVVKRFPDLTAEMSLVRPGLSKPDIKVVSMVFDWVPGARLWGYPLLRGQNRITKTISQMMPQPIHVMFG